MISTNITTSNQNFVKSCETVSYENPFCPTKHNYHVISANFFRKEEASNEVILDKIQSIFKNAIKPLAIIISTSFDYNDAFKEDRGFFISNRQELLRNDYEVVQIKDVGDPNQIEKILYSVPHHKIGFFHIRGHGQPNEIVFSDNISLRSQDILNIFNWLPQKLNPQSTLYFESCNTGNISEKEFYNNIQFSFGKLTKDLLEVKINHFPLCQAIQYRNKAIIELLLEKGADVFIEHEGMSPLKTQLAPKS